MKDTPAVGVVVGKFNPPHRGHVHLIETGASMVEVLYAILADRSDQTVRAVDRARWLTDACPPNVEVIITPDDLPEDNEPWAERALQLLPAAPDLAFTSEPWGPGWAAAMGAEHVEVDLARTTIPISATELRLDLGANFRWLVPRARSELARRVVCIGAESTGKTSLAQALAAELGTVWIPEHGRWYWEGRRHLADQGWTTDEFRRIATAQQELGNDLARLSPQGVVVADTDASVTAAWHERFIGHADAHLDAFARRHSPDLYLLCAPDFAWVQDGTRESEHHRAAMHTSMLERAAASSVPTVSLEGTRARRLADALDAVATLPPFPSLI